MGGKPDHSLRSNRPESGGADKDEHFSNSDMPERDKQRFAQNEHEKRIAEANAQRAAADGKDQPYFPSEFSIDNPRNPDPNNK